MSNFMRKPNLLVHLEVTPEESMERIKGSLFFDKKKKLLFAHFLNKSALVDAKREFRWSI
jgi:hypothetical protein